MKIERYQMDFHRYPATAKPTGHSQLQLQGHTFLYRKHKDCVSKIRLPFKQRHFLTCKPCKLHEERTLSPANRIITLFSSSGTFLPLRQWRYAILRYFKIRYVVWNYGLQPLVVSETANLAATKPLCYPKRPACKYALDPERFLINRTSKSHTFIIFDIIHNLCLEVNINNRSHIRKCWLHLDLRN